MIQQAEESPSEPGEKYLRSSHCFACGSGNARGLGLEFRKGEDGGVAANWIPEDDFEGYSGMIHGGIVSTVLDEAMAKVVAGTGAKALTAELRVRFRRQVSPGVPVQIEGWIETRNRRMFRTEAALIGVGGDELAHAWAVFLPLK